jgi:hypothetical protein
LDRVRWRANTIRGLAGRCNAPRPHTLDTRQHSSILIPISLTRHGRTYRRSLWPVAVAGWSRPRPRPLHASVACTALRTSAVDAVVRSPRCFVGQARVALPPSASASASRTPHDGDPCSRPRPCIAFFPTAPVEVGTLVRELLALQLRATCATESPILTDVKQSRRGLATTVTVLASGSHSTQPTRLALLIPPESAGRLRLLRGVSHVVVAVAVNCLTKSRP